MDTAEIREDLKSLDDKLDKIMIQVALNTTSINNMPSDIKSAIVNLQFKYAVLLLTGLAGGVYWILDSFIPAIITDIIKAQT